MSDAVALGSLGAGQATGRLAPSPTGNLHVGHARTFLVAWLAARAEGGRMVLRIEDLDVGRVQAGAKTGIINDLRRLGLDWDEGPDIDGPYAPYEQSERLDVYQDALDRLTARNLVYPCTCTRSDIERAATAPHTEDEAPTYPGFCRLRDPNDAARLRALGLSFGWRFRVPAGEIVWEDRVLGRVARNPSRLGGDFVVARESPASALRSGGTSAWTVTYAYQLAVIVDDAAMKITQVVRGDDLAASTPRQIALAHALGLPTPIYAHVPLVVGPNGRRLSKRDGSIKLASLFAGGLEPATLVETLARSCGLRFKTPISSCRDLIGTFDFEALTSSEWTWPAIKGAATSDHKLATLDSGSDPPRRST